MKELLIALAGNPNSGKTTAFNAFTGARQHVGNYPGITVEKKEGTASYHGENVRMVDLPGTYSLTAYTQEEVVARRVLVDERPDVVLDVLNTGALERNLYLTVQLLEMGLPLVLALNMIDEARDQGMTIDTELLAKRLGIAIVETVARKNKGLDEALGKAIALGKARRAEQQADSPHKTNWQPLRISYGPDINPSLTTMEELVHCSGMLAELYPARWVALKYLENDADIVRQCRVLMPACTEKLDLLVQGVSAHLDSTLNTTPEAVIADYRYGFISSILRGVLVRQSSMDTRLVLSDRMDHVLTHQFLGPLIMLAILYAVYQVTFVFGAIPMGWVESGFGWLRDLASANLPDGNLKSLIVSGVIDGAGGVISFVPLIMLIFLQIAVLEDVGYMARMAYMLDRIFRIFGLHGCAVMPFIVSGGIAGGCAVPGVYASRTLRSQREKLATMLTLPFMACGAKLPVFILIAGAFFPGNAPAVMFILTLVGWATALLVARLLRSTIIRGPSTPFVMELPPYRLPTLRGLLIHCWERTWEYLKKAGTVILAISILLWAAMTFPKLPENVAEQYAQTQIRLEQQIGQARLDKKTDVTALEENLRDSQNAMLQQKLQQSLAGRVGTVLEPVTRFAGFDWRVNIALLGGFAAKEVIVATLGTAFSLGDIDAEESGPLSVRIRSDLQWSAYTALGLILFVLLYAPCFATVVAIRQESGSWGWALFSILFNTALAFGVAVACHQFGTL